MTCCTEIDAAAFDGKDHEVGEILGVGDGVATVSGIRHAAYGEIVQFESGVKGMVQDIRREETGIILLGSEKGAFWPADGWCAPSGVPVCRWARPSWAAWWMPWAPPLTARARRCRPVTAPLKTPPLALRTESPFRSRWRPVFWPSTACSPIDGGQRELIIGDRQTGKTLSPPIPS